MSKKLSVKDRRSEITTIRLSPVVKKRAQAAAKKADLTLSSFIAKVLEEAGK